MKWGTIKHLHESMIGKVILFFGVASLLTLITPLEVIVENFHTSIALVGAILVSISFLGYKIFIPEIIVRFDSQYEYFVFYSSLVENHSDVASEEFSDLEEEDIFEKVKSLVVGSVGVSEGTFRISSVIKTLSSKRAAKELCRIQYALKNDMYTCIRWLISIMFILGLVLMYWPAIHRVCGMLFGGFTND